MEFKDLAEVKKAFMTSEFKIGEKITVGGAPYHKYTSSEHPMLDMMEKNYKGVVIYSIDPGHKEEIKGDLKPWILFLWGFTPSAKMVPFDVRTMTRARAEGRTITEKEVTELPDNIIGSTVEVRFTNLAGSGYMKGKVDTGATICSLHADNYKINRQAGTITFKSPKLSRNELTVPLVDQQSVKSADGGSEYRPVVELNIKVNNKILSNVKFNLNDRSHMEFPVLLGKNALEAGNFMINPKLDEGVDWEALQEEFKDIEIPDNSVEDALAVLQVALATVKIED